MPFFKPNMSGQSKDDIQRVAYYSNFPKDFFRPYGYAYTDDVTSTEKMQQKLKPFNCEWLARPQVAASEAASTIQENIKTLCKARIFFSRDDILECIENNTNKYFHVSYYAIQHHLPVDVIFSFCSFTKFWWSFIWGKLTEAAGALPRGREQNGYRNQLFARIFSQFVHSCNPFPHVKICCRKLTNTYVSRQAGVQGIQKNALSHYVHSKKRPQSRIVRWQNKQLVKTVNFTFFICIAHILTYILQETYGARKRQNLEDVWFEHTKKNSARPKQPQQQWQRNN